VVGGQQFGVSPHSFGIPVGGAREHPQEPSTTVPFPFVPVTVLNDSIVVTTLGPSTVDHSESAS
jgi:hypothetical protein